MTIKELKNLDHSFDISVGDIGVTIRLGNKWSLNPGEVFHLVEQYSNERKDEYVGQGKSIGFWYGKFSELPEKLLQIEHNIEARNKEILYNMMKAGYGDQFDIDSHITALIYERVSLL